MTMHAFYSSLAPGVEQFVSQELSFVFVTHTFLFWFVHSRIVISILVLVCALKNYHLNFLSIFSGKETVTHSYIYPTHISGIYGRGRLM
jgi:hypothetical protein